jgi:hypothetical protein
MSITEDLKASEIAIPTARKDQYISYEELSIFEHNTFDWGTMTHFLGPQRLLNYRSLAFQRFDVQKKNSGVGVKVQKKILQENT